MKCKHCRNYDPKGCWCEMIVDSPDEEMERDCAYYITKTNADRIREMSDAELAKFLNVTHDFVLDGEFLKVLDGNTIDDDVDSITDWLQSGVIDS